jgi:hypothetical protein
MSTDPADLWAFLPLGYALSVVLETPVLLVGLAPRHSLGRRLLAGVWLTACTYPIVVLVLPQLIWRPLGEQAGYWPYAAVAEVFAPAAECLLFALAFWTPLTRAGSDPAGTATTPRRDFTRDMLAIVAANLTSFVVGWWLFYFLGTSR